MTNSETAMRHPAVRVAALCGVVLLAACGSTTASTSASTATRSAEATTASPSATATASAAAAIVNTWSGVTVDPKALPLGDSRVSTTAAAVGSIFACQPGDPNGGGAFKDGPWINAAAGTWDSTTKVSVSGTVSWPTADYTETVNGASRYITSHGVPVKQVSGTFPIPSTDDAYNYDRNPNHIAERKIAIALPSAPRAATTTSCLPAGAVGILRNGVVLFASLDQLNRDAVAHETQDVCEGHPEQTSTYHYHNVPNCIVNAAMGSSTVVGFATDGFPIVVERDAKGNLPTNADLDKCHGRTSPITLDGAVVSMYHYSATLEFPYMMGCLTGTSALK
ncbi:MAG: YHYH protein [Actinomycetes bacterium]